MPSILPRVFSCCTKSYKSKTLNDFMRLYKTSSNFRTEISVISHPTSVNLVSPSGIHMHYNESSQVFEIF